MLAPLAFVFGLSAMVHRMQPATARLVFLAFAAVMGLSMSSIFLVFTGTSIARTFFVTAAAFGGLSLWGYTTNRDISGWGSFLFMGLIGLIIAMLVNLFLGSTALQFAISVIGLLIFAGLTAYDTQRLKHTYDYVAGDAVAAGRASIIGALQLYLDFINLFMFLLQFMGNRE
jgi:FtsH-binding integral membrane protein